MRCIQNHWSRSNKMSTSLLTNSSPNSLTGQLTRTYTRLTARTRGVQVPFMSNAACFPTQPTKSFDRLHWGKTNRFRQRATASVGRGAWNVNELRVLISFLLEYQHGNCGHDMHMYIYAGGGGPGTEKLPSSHVRYTALSGRFRATSRCFTRSQFITAPVDGRANTGSTLELAETSVARSPV